MGTGRVVRGFIGDQRGMALLDMLIACAILATLAVATASAIGLRSARSHTSAMSLEAALADARSLANANSESTYQGVPSGATVVVQADPLFSGSSQIQVFSSRPVILDGVAPQAPKADAGYPLQHVPGTFVVSQSSAAGSSHIGEPFAIMLSGGGFASIVALNGPYDSSAPQTFANDPGCASGNTAVVITVGGTSDTFAFECTGGKFVAN